MAVGQIDGSNGNVRIAELGSSQAQQRQSVAIGIGANAQDRMQPSQDFDQRSCVRRCLDFFTVTIPGYLKTLFSCCFSREVQRERHAQQEAPLEAHQVVEQMNAEYRQRQDRARRLRESLDRAMFGPPPSE